MGELWEVINPLINMIVMVLIFGKMLGTGIAGGFPLYVLTGTTIYGLFTSGTTLCLNALFGNKNFLIKTRLSKNIYILEKIFVAFRNFLFSLMIYAFVLALYRIPPSVTWLLFIPDILLLLVMMTGIGKILAVINVTFADITYFIKFLPFSNVFICYFYHITRLSPTMQNFMLINPLYIVITIARKCMMECAFPDWKMWVILGLYAAGCYLAGTVYFNKK